ncbi:hypothetical protein ON010_g15468 [Phytophthora cinnamomi]|nr:hypothetical protein ON010_g15468 [Phytophthora cinnamomi]
MKPKHPACRAKKSITIEKERTEEASDNDARDSDLGGRRTSGADQRGAHAAARLRRPAASAAGSPCPPVAAAESKLVF